MKGVAKTALPAAVLTGAAGFIGYRMMNGFLLGREPEEDDSSAGKEKQAPEYYQKYLAEKEYNESFEMEDWIITSGDGLKLYASYLPAEGEAVRNIILCHGYHSSSRRDFGGILRFYHGSGCNLLLIEERAHRRSEGKYITMGIRESEDVALWCREMVRRLGGELPLYLHGMSMGAAAVLMAEGEQLPDNTKGIIADCGFTSPVAIAKEVMRKNVGALTVPAMALVNICAIARLGLSMDEKSATEILRKAEIPVLFIHGTGDDFVPVHMTIKNYHACAAPKRICLVDGAPHAMSWFFDEEKYKKALDDFFRDFH